MNDQNYPSEPTAEQCTQRASLGNRWYALWYPQMGGYVGKAAVHIDVIVDGCVDVLVWHDGSFPFSGDDSERNPVRLHHCDVDQFRTFADDIDAIRTDSLLR